MDLLRIRRRGSSRRPAERWARRRVLGWEQLEPRTLMVSTLSVGNSTFNLAAGSAGFTVTRSGTLTTAVDVGYTVTAGTAVVGTNYTTTAPTGFLDFAPNQTTATIPLKILTNNFTGASLNFTVNLTGIVPTSSSAATFAAQTTFATGTNPYSVTTADLNGDGKPDLIIANYKSATVSVLLNTTATGATAPSFAAQVTFGTGSGPQSVTTADINGDGKPDIIVANRSSASVSVLLNNTLTGATSPSFATQATLATGINPWSVTAADMNGDGKPDIITANYGSLTVSVLFNTTANAASTASFATQATFAVGSAPLSVTTGDLNGDGKPDIIVANSGNNNVSVLLNTTATNAATPSFSAQVVFGVGSLPRSVTTADVNGDGKPDIITANNSSNNVSVLLNTTATGATTPSFATQSTFATGTGPQSVTTAYLNGDGTPDIIVADQTAGNVWVLQNTTAAGATVASFANGTAFTTGTSPKSVAAVDLNGDGMPDLIVANYGFGNVSALLNTTAFVPISASATNQTNFTVGTNPASVTVADLNGDGKPDLIIANYGSNTVSVLLNTTANSATIASFATQVTFATGTNPVSVTTADLNGDGKPDLIVLNHYSTTVSVLLNTTTTGATTPSFLAQVTFATGSKPNTVSTADLNGDGKPDIVVTNFGSNSVSVLLNTTATNAATPSFAAQATFATGTGPLAVKAADINGDGRADLIVVNSGSSTVSVLLNTTATNATVPSFAAQATFTTGTTPFSVTTADLNGDGKPDIVVANFGSTTVSVLLNTTATNATVPNFAAQATFTTGTSPRSVTAADVNGDGKPDIVVANFGSGTVSVLLNTTTIGATVPSFAAQITSAVGTSPESVAAVDLNADGAPDLIVANYASANVSVLTNTSAAAISISAAIGTIEAAPVTSSIVLANANPTVLTTVQFTVTFDASVSGVTAANFVLTGTATSGASIGTPTSVGGIIWTVPVTTGVTGTLGINLSSRAGITGVYGNFLYSSTADNGTTFTTFVGPLYIVDATTTTVVTALPNPSIYGQSVTFTATITNTIGGGVPTGSVSFYNGGVLLAAGSALTGSGSTATSIYAITTLVAGSYIIYAIYTATSTFVSSTSANVTQVVNKAALTITAVNQTKVYGAVLPALTASYVGFVNGDNSTNLTTQPTIITTGTAASPVGTYPITAQSAVDPNYAISYVGGTLTVTTATLTITAVNQSKVYGAALPTLTATYSGFVNGDTTASLTPRPTITTAGTLSSVVGTYPITATGAVDPNYTISYVAGTLTVSVATLTVTANAGTKVYGTTKTFAGTEFTTTGLVNGNTVTSVTLTSTGAIATATVAGSPYPILVSAAVGTGLTNYSIIYTSGSLIVTTASLTITAVNQTKLYGAALPSLTVGYSAFAGSETSASLTTAPTVTTPATAASPVGSYALTAAGAVDSNYTFTYVAGTLSVTVATLTITAANQTKVYGAALPTLTATYAGFVNGDTSANLTAQTTITTTATTSSVVGTYTITATGAVDANYTISYVAGTLTVTTATLTITAANQTKVYGAALPTLTVSYAGFVNGDTSASLTPQPAITTTAAVGSAVGTYPITASGAVDANYTIAYITGTLTVNTAQLTITAVGYNKVYGAAMPTLTASYRGFVNGDTVASLTTGPTLSTTATAQSDVGVYTISASGAVDPDYSFVYVVGALTVSAAPLTVTAGNQSKVYGATEPTLTYSVSGLVNGDTASVVTGVTLSTTTAAAATAGTHIITASGGVAANYAISDVSGILTVSQAALTVTADNQSKVYGATDPTLTYTPSGALYYSDTYSVITGVVLSTTTGAAATAGTHTITATGGTAANYSISDVSGILTVSQAALTVTAHNETKVYGATDPTLTYTVGGALSYSDTYSVITGVVLSTTTGAAATAGTHTITASGGTAANYSVTDLNGILTVYHASLTITASNETKTYGATTTFAGTEFNTSGLAYGDTVTSTTLTSAGAGSTATVAGSPYAIVPTAAIGTGLTNYTILYTNGNLTVTAATLTITAHNETKIYGNAVTFAGTDFTTTGLLNSDTVSSVTETSTGAAATATVAGSPYAIIPSAAVGGGLANYAILYMNGNLTVTTAMLTIVANNASKPYGTTLTFAGTEFTTVGLANADSVTSVALTSTGAVATATVPGSPYPINASAAMGTGLANYAITYITGSLVVFAATPTVTWATPADITYGIPLGATQLDAIASVPGSFVYTPAAATVLHAGTAEVLSVTFTPTDALDHNSVTTTTLINVDQATPTITWANPANITYGTTLTSLQLDATASTTGSFVYSPVAGTTLNASDNQTLSVTFTPGDTADYTTNTATVTINVLQATPGITWANPASITYGTALGGTQLDATSPLGGTFAYSPASGTILSAGNNQTLSSTFTPTDTTDYRTIIATVLISVLKATPIVTWANPADITYGTLLSASQLDATASVPGGFLYTPPSGTLLNSGDNQTLSLAFTPTDTADYTSATAMVRINVRNATSGLTWANPSSITYATPLGATQLDATDSIPGTFVYTPAAGTVLGAASNQTLSVTFTPTDTADYSPATTIVAINVLQAVPTVNWTNPASITYGSALGATQLDATASVPGNFLYNPAAGVVLTAGSGQTLSTTFTPTDNIDYTTIMASVTINVSQNNLTVTWANPANITYGTKLGPTQLDATASVPGTFAYTPVAGTVLKTGGNQTLSVSFTPADATDYSPATATVAINVLIAATAVTWANPANITFGTALVASQLDARSSVAGTFAYSPVAGTVLGGGNNQTLTVTFSPTDTLDYSPTTATALINVLRAAPAITWANPASITYGTPLGSAQLDPTAQVPGTFAYTPAAGTILSAGGNQMLTATFTPTDITDYEPVTVTAQLSVLQANTIVSWATPADITYGTALGSTQLDASATVPGTFVYSPGFGTGLPAGNDQTLSVIFTPTDTNDYANAAGLVYINVKPETPILSWANPANITYGTALGATQLNATALVPGSFAYTPAAGDLPGAGNGQILSVIFTPTNTADYLSATGTVMMNVLPATPTVMWANPAGIVHGTALSALQWDATASEPGLFVYAPATNTVLSAGLDQTLTVTFTPTDNIDYNQVTQTAYINVARATPAITWANPAEITYGTALTATQLDATAVAGTFVYAPAAGIVLSAGNGQMLSVSFTPTDTTNYLSATATASINVEKETPTVTWADPTGITYGTPLSSTQLDASGSVAGSFSYRPAAGTVVPAGSADSLTSVFTPTDLIDYNTVPATAYIAVAQATPTITWANPIGIIYGTALDATQLDASAPISGTFTYKPAAGVVLSAGNGQTLSVTFTPTDTTDYLSATATVTINVSSASETISWPEPSAIIYGTPLSDTQLDAAASVGGTYAYSQPLGTILSAGDDQTLSVLFTPTDTSQSPISASVSIDVNQAVPTVSWSNPSSIVYGTPITGTQLDATASTAGTFAYTPGLLTILPVGSSDTLSVIFSPTDALDYTLATGTAQITVTQAQPVVTWVKPSNITYGTNLSSAQLDATASVAGTFVYSPAAGTPLNAGNNQPLNVIFTPSDVADYLTANGATTITVNPAAVTITWPSPADITYGTVLGTTQYNATASVAGGVFTYSPSPGTILSAGNNQPISVSFTPGSTNYSPAFATVDINVLQAAPVVTWAAPMNITYGTPLGPDQLDATASVPGTFAYSPGTLTILPVGQAEPLSVIFYPTDSTDYQLATADTTINVGVAPLFVVVRDETRYVGQANPRLTVTYSGFVNGDTAATLTTAPVLTTPAGPSSPAGTYPILVDSVSSSDYAIQVINGTLTVSPALVTVQKVSVEILLTGKYLKTKTKVIVVQFSGGVNAASALNLGAYGLDAVVPVNKHKTKLQALKLAAAYYNSSTSSVTLTVRKALSLSQALQITVNGNLVLDLFGRPIDGAGAGDDQSGSSYVESKT